MKHLYVSFSSCFHTTRIAVQVRKASLVNLVSCLMPSLLFLVAHASTAAASGMHPQSSALQLSHRRLHEVDEDGGAEVSDSLEPERPAPEADALQARIVPVGFFNKGIEIDFDVEWGRRLLSYLGTTGEDVPFVGTCTLPAQAPS